MEAGSSPEGHIVIAKNEGDCRNIVYSCARSTKESSLTVLLSISSVLKITEPPDLPFSTASLCVFHLVGDMCAPNVQLKARILARIQNEHNLKR